MPLSAIGENPANAGVARLCGVSPYPVPDTDTALPNQARYQLRYTRILSFCHYTTAGRKIKDFSVCGHSCGQSRFYATFGNLEKSSKRRCHKALRRFALPCPGYRHGTPKPPALPTALHPVVKFLPIQTAYVSGLTFILTYILYINTVESAIFFSARLPHCAAHIRHALHIQFPQYRENCRCLVFLYVIIWIYN